MLRNMYAMLDYHITASDWELGRVQDFLFDDKSWIVRYLVVETGAWGSGERILVVPFVVGFSEWKSKQFPILLTREQLQASPPLERDKPISLQYPSGLKQPGAHLRSIREVFGYRIHSSKGEMGSIDDFIVEDAIWSVRSVVVTLSGESGPVRFIMISPETIRSISWQAKSAWTNRLLSEGLASPAFDPREPVNQGEEQPRFDYRGRPVDARCRI